MTILSIAQNAAKRCQIPSPSTLVGSTDGNNILLLSMIEKAAQDLQGMHAWPELVKEHTFTLATDTAAYALPTDLDRILTESLWNRTQKVPLQGPLDPVEWQQYKSGLVTSLASQRFRIKGWATNQFFIDSTPSSTENGQICAFEYISSTVIRPKTWTASTSWSGFQYCSYNGNIYDRGATSALSTGTTAPTHTSGAVSDGTITWTYTNAVFNTATYDSDEVILDNQLVTDGAVWMFKRERGFDYAALEKEWRESIEISAARLAGAEVISVRNHRLSSPMIGPWSYPEGNYGI